MTPELWQRVKAVFASARELPESERARFLDDACHGDATLRAEIESLLTADQVETRFDIPPIEDHSRLRDAVADRYRLERDVGGGGMATVYLAHDLKHDRPVALKVLHRELTASLGAQRFAREIKLAARLRHPHILPVYDSGQTAGVLWFTMPYVEESLRSRLVREKQLPVEEALRIVREVAAGLQYAHEHGVVHRDIKPENILLDAGRALLGDFGIARCLMDGEPQITGTGVAIGTPAYMSPEQASGATGVDARTDVYALGCVLFELLAGEPPYTGPTPQAIIGRALTERPRPIHPVRPAVPRAVDAVIAKAMAATPADRFASADELSCALDLAMVNGADGRARSPMLFARRPQFAMLALGVLLGAGGLFAWRWTHGGEETTGPNLVAVLPFQSLGGATDDYLPDGIADEIRGRLASLPGVRVIARGSSTAYKNTTKSPGQVARELGARYLLTATVVTERAATGGSALHLNAELTQVPSRGEPIIKWEQPFEVSLNQRSLAGAFEVYGEVAGRVAHELGVAMAASTRHALAAAPTRSPASYEAYLRGAEVSRGFGASDVPTLRRAATYYERAVALDSNFVEAWTHVSWVHSLAYFNGEPRPRDAELALGAARRAAALAPHSPGPALAMGYYYQLVAKDNARAIEEFERGLALAPNDPDLLNAVAIPEESVGRWEDALAHRQRAATLDPRNVGGGGGDLLWILLSLRRYAEAEQVADRALALAPTDLGIVEERVMIALAQGDLAGARAIIRRVPKEVGQDKLVALFAGLWDLYWVLDEPQQGFVLQLTPAAWDGNRAAWGYTLAETSWLRGDLVRTLAYADSARIAFEQQIRAAPQDAQLHVLYGVVLAYLGRKAAALREGEQGVSLMPISKDALFGAFIQHELVRIYMLVGEPEKALDQLEPLLKIPYYLSPGWLKIDPTFDPLRSNPRFQRLVAGNQAQARVSSRRSHARATAHSRLTVAGDIPRTWAVSSIPRPVK